MPWSFSHHWEVRDKKHRRRGSAEPTSCLCLRVKPCGAITQGNGWKWYCVYVGIPQLIKCQDIVESLKNDHLTAMLKITYCGSSINFKIVSIWQQDRGSGEECGKCVVGINKQSSAGVFCAEPAVASADADTDMLKQLAVLQKVRRMI